jgi:hypothetical protein
MFEERLELIDHEIRKLEEECASLYLHVVVNKDASSADEKLYDLKVFMLESYKDQKREILEENGK